MKKDDKNNKEDNKIIFKIITLGDTDVGKTSIIRRFIYNSFEDNMMSTTGINYSLYELTLKNNKKVSLKIIDTAGQEKYKGLTKGYFQNADGALFVFAVNNEDSFENIKSWMEIFENSNCSLLNFPKILVGNKNDLESEVDEKNIEEFLESNPTFIYKSTSAKKDADNNIKKLFQELGEKIYENYIKNEKKKSKTIKLMDGNKQKKKNCLLNCIL